MGGEIKISLGLKQVKKRYNRFSLIYDLLTWPVERLVFARWRRNALKGLKGRILEIGVGTGKNLIYYDYDEVELVGVDISKGMLDRARTKAKDKGYPVTLKLLSSEKLPFKENRFDYVVSTFLLCSVSDQIKMLREMKRVLNGSGKIIMLEHMLSQNKLIAFFENLHNPLARFLFGCNVNRDTIKSIKKSGLKIFKSENLALKDVFKKLEVAKK